jgi:hypothetical protein
VLVEVMGQPAVGRRRQHLDGGLPETQPAARAQLEHGDTPLLGDDQRLGGSGCGDPRMLRGGRWDEQCTDLEPVEHRRQPRHMVVVGVGHRDGVDAADPAFA